MTVGEFVDWQRFTIEHPFPADLIDAHGSMSFALAANINRAEGGPTFDPLDFVLVRPGRTLDPPPPPDKPKTAPAISEADRMLSIFH